MGVSCQKIKHIYQADQLLIVEPQNEQIYDEWKEEIEHVSLEENISKVSTFSPKFLYSNNEEERNLTILSDNMDTRVDLCQQKIFPSKKKDEEQSTKGILKIRTFQKEKLDKKVKNVQFSPDTKAEASILQQRIPLSRFIVLQKNLNAVNVFS